MLNALTLLDALGTAVVGVLVLYWLVRHAEKQQKVPALRLYWRGGPKCHGAPRRKTASSAGYDLYTTKEEILQPGGVTAVPTDLYLEIPEGYAGIIRPRSSAFRRGIFTQGTIDSDYRGEIMIMAANMTPNPVIVPAGTAIAQLILTPVAAPPAVYTLALSVTERGSKGFGSTGDAL
jgi:dUTP pyrophosphatase